jgi:UDP-glucuronate 4-epimerase
MIFLITGSCGFVGFHLTEKLLKLNHKVIGIDNISNYYDPRIKKIRLNILKKNKKFKFLNLDLSKKNFSIKENINKIDCIVHLAAQAGVKYSLKNPMAYYENNIISFAHILEITKSLKIKQLIYASSSSVYGDLDNKVFNEKKIGKPLSNYSLTKQFNEQMADFYSNKFKLTTVGLRFFNVYGTFGRPDMALWIFVKNALKNKSINLHNFGRMKRSFTYVDDIINSIILIINKKKYNKKNTIYNIGNSKTIKLFNLIKIIEKKLKKKIKYKKIPIQFGEIQNSKATNQKFFKEYKFKPKITINEGVNKFINWYLEYQKKFKWL